MIETIIMKKLVFLTALVGLFAVAAHAASNTYVAKRNSQAASTVSRGCCDYK